MKSWMAGFIFLAACTPDFGLLAGPESQTQPDADTPDTPPGVTIVRVPEGDITTNTTWRKTSIYILEGYVWVTGNATLTIEEGTTIRGQFGSALTITRDGNLDAAGTAAEPIVFTSAQSTPASGDWGGVVLLGKATINVTGGENTVEGFATSFGDRIKYGTPTPGTPDDTFDCGRLRYARIEYAGFALAVDRELNGLTVAGCGTDTEIDYVQVHLGNDDGIEMFGGTANLKHIVITQPDDDALDWDFGWNGKVQNLVVQQRMGRGDRAFESDNNVNNNDALPRSQPVIWNATLIGGDGPAANKRQGGLHLRRGTAGQLSNAIVAYFNQYAVDLDGRSTRDQYIANELSIKHTYFVKSTNASAVWPPSFDRLVDYDDDMDPGTPPIKIENDCDSPPATGCYDEATAIAAEPTNFVDVDPLLIDAKNVVTPNWKPQAGAPVLTGCAAPPTDGFFDISATYCGAIGILDWTEGWTAYP